MRSKGAIAFAVGLLALAAAAGLGFGGLLADRDVPEGQNGSGGGGTTPTTPVTPTPGETEPADGAFTAEVSTSSVAPNERLTISGSMSGAEAGVALVVQREEDGNWADFPAQTTTGPDGSFSLDVELGRPGDNVLRMVAPSTGAASEPVTVTVG